MDERKFTLSQALAKAGGLNDSQASVKDVYLFRFESKSHLKSLGVNLPSGRFTDGWPTLYRLNMEDPKAFLLASSVPMKHNDMLYVASAPASEFKKFIEHVVGPFLVTERAIQNIAR